MKEFFFNTIQEFNDYIGVKTLHPLVSIARVENTSPIQEAVFARTDRERCDALRTDSADVPRYEHQHGDAAVQDAGRRYGK